MFHEKKVIVFLKKNNMAYIIHKRFSCSKFNINLFDNLRRNYSHGHNIMRIFDALLNFPFTTSETKPDY